MNNFADMVGILGSILLIIAYLSLQSGKLKGNSYLYLYLNLSGATLILFSLYFFPNRPAILIELFWVFISIYGIWKRKRSSL